VQSAVCRAMLVSPLLHTHTKVTGRRGLHKVELIAAFEEELNDLNLNIQRKVGESRGAEGHQRSLLCRSTPSSGQLFI
jgi:hypothetical protein